MRRLERREGVLFDGDWLPLAGVPVAEAKALLRDSGISYFSDAIVNGRQVPVAHVLRPRDQLVLSRRFGFKAGGAIPIEGVIGKAMVSAYPELLEIEATVEARNLPTHESVRLKTSMVSQWMEGRFGPPDASTMAVLADIMKRLQRIESVLVRGHTTENRDRHALAGAQHGGIMADGLQPPDRFRLFGKEYKGISRDQWLLLKALWPQRTAEIEDVMEQVYGTNFKQEQEALRSVARRLTECLGRQSCPAEIVVRNGYCTLEIFDEQRKVPTDQRTTG